MFSHQGAWVNNRDGPVFSSNTSTGQPSLTAPMSSYQPNNQIGGNPWVLTEITEDQAPTPDGSLSWDQTLLLNKLHVS